MSIPFEYKKAEAAHPRRKNAASWFQLVEPTAKLLLSKQTSTLHNDILSPSIFGSPS
jgi:hypothetical protein